MRLNKYIAAHTTNSRRKADELIARGSVTINGQTAGLGTRVQDTDKVFIDQKLVRPRVLEAAVTLMLNKPVGYVCSRKGQGAPTVYSLIPLKYHHLDIVGRLDKASSGLLLLTSDGALHQQLTHPSYQKEKVYHISLDKPLITEHITSIKTGVQLKDGPSKLQIKSLQGQGKLWEVRMHEGRNRQIRRTFAVLGYDVLSLERLRFGDHTLGDLASGIFKVI